MPDNKKPGFLERIKTAYNELPKASVKEREQITRTAERGARFAGGVTRGVTNFGKTMGNRFGGQAFGKKEEKSPYLEAQRRMQSYDLSGLTPEQQKELRKYEIQREYDIAKEEAKQKTKFALDMAREKAKVERERERAYGPAYNLPIVGQSVGRLSQYRGYQQEQDIKQLKKQSQLEYQRLQLEKIRQQREQSGGMGSGFGVPLTMGGGLGMGGGYNTPQQPFQQGGYPQENRDPLSLPIIGGLGGNPFMSQEQPQPQVQTIPYETSPRARQPQVQIVRRAPSRLSAPGYGYESEPGSIFRKIEQPYGASFKKISPEEIIPGEKIYKRVREPYGHKYVIIK